MTFACCFMLTNFCLIHMISIHLTRLYPWLQNESFLILFYCVLPFFLHPYLVYLKFHLKIEGKKCVRECVRCWMLFIRGMNFLTEFSCEMLKGSNDEHQSTTHMAFLLPASSYIHISSCSCILKVKTFFDFYFWSRQKIIDK